MYNVIKRNAAFFYQSSLQQIGPMSCYSTNPYSGLSWSLSTHSFTVKLPYTNLPELKMIEAIVSLSKNYDPKNKDSLVFKHILRNLEALQANAPPSYLPEAYRVPLKLNRFQPRQFIKWSPFLPPQSPKSTFLKSINVLFGSVTTTGKNARFLKAVKTLMPLCFQKIL